MSTRDLYRYTSIGRPLDPSYPTNRAVLRLLPAAAFVAAAIHALRHGIEPGLLWAAVGGALAAFGGWALARELVPDHQAPAFAAMALAFGAWLTLAGTPLLPVFVALLAGAGFLMGKIPTGFLPEEDRGVEPEARREEHDQVVL